MKMKRIISMFLAVLFVLSLCSMNVGAADTPGSGSTTTKVEYKYNTSSITPTIIYFADKNQEGWAKDKVTKFETPEAKIAKMDLRLQKNGYQIYVDEFSGEIACKKMETGEILMTNPYNIGASTANEAVKYELMSQVHINYTDNGNVKDFYSFAEASLRNQVKVKNIKNGIRVEYTIGREETKLLLPKLIQKDRFEQAILAIAAKNLESEGGKSCLKYLKLEKFYNYQSLELCKTDEQRALMIKTFPITKKYDVYVLDSETIVKEELQLESLIKTYVPSYSYEDLERDHEMVEYEGEEDAYPLFKVALEYTLDENGLSVSLPANGIRFDESRYQMNYISVLPYMGAGYNSNKGYTFFPDGSGSIFNFESLATKNTATTIEGKVYGADYAYQTITTTHQETIRYPVFGIKETLNLPVPNASADEGGVTETFEQDRGFVAIIEEGDSMATLQLSHEVKRHTYNSIKMNYFPRPKDTYNMRDSISVGSNANWTVVSSRKYTGNYTTRYVMLTDQAIAEEIQRNLPDGEVYEYYECSYLGMANAYRDYLYANGTLQPLTEEDIKEDIPLYVNVFGAIETTKKILSVPVDVTVPLTSFEDIEKMHADLVGDDENSNVIFKLTGFANGGMYSTVPYRLAWEKAVGGDEGFEALIKNAADKGFMVVPDFDFVYVTNTGLFDGLSLKKHAVKSIDNRYTSRREYSATKQAQVSYYDLCLSPAYFEHFYTKLTENLLSFFGEDYRTAISVGTLGSELNSDFDEDEPYNREDAKEFTVRAFQFLDENYDYVMTSAGNAYTWKYVDYILDVPLDSSRFVAASASVPFMGIVLHGSVQFAGTPINMEGNVDYAFLKAIENGASVQFVLSYQNTTTLKEDHRLSKYYSVRYDIWKTDVLEIYNELNGLLSDVQLEAIIDHDFIEGMRIPDMDEFQQDLDQALLDLIEDELEAKNAAYTQYIADVLAARQLIQKNYVQLPSYLAEIEGAYNGILADHYSVDENGNIVYSVKMQGLVDTFNKCALEYAKAYNGAQASVTPASLATVRKNLDNAAMALYGVFDQQNERTINNYAQRAYRAEENALNAYNACVEAYQFLETVEGDTEDILRLAKELIDRVAEEVATICDRAPEVYELAQKGYDSIANADVAVVEGVNFNSYQFYLLAAAKDLTVSPANAFQAKYVLQRYVPGFAKTDISVDVVRAFLEQSFGITEDSPNANYGIMFDTLLAAVDLAYTKDGGFKQAYEAYVDGVFAEGEANLLRTAAVTINSAMANLLTKTFSARGTSEAVFSRDYAQEDRDALVEAVNAFTLLYGSFDAATATPEEIAAMKAAADELNAKLAATDVQYLHGYTKANIYAYLESAQKHYDSVSKTTDIAKNLWDTLVEAGASEELIASAKAYYESYLAQKEALAPMFEEVTALVEGAYDYVAESEAYKAFKKAEDQIADLVENDADGAYFANTFNAVLLPYGYVEEEKGPEEDEAKKEYNKYSSDSNGIVIVTYANGVRFVLNYQNFAVVVEIDGVSYRVDAQSYKKLPAVEMEVENNDQ